MSMLTSKNFTEAQPRSLNIFSIPSTQTAVEDIFFQESRPISQVSGQSPIEFQISGQNGMEYLDLSRTRLYVKLKIVKSDGSSLSASEKCAPVNLLLQNLWSQVDVTLQGKLLSSQSNHYAYKSIIQTLLNYGEDYKKTQLTSQLYIKDTPGELEQTDPFGANSGLFERQIFMSQSKSVDVEGCLFTDIFQIERYILNQVNIGVKLYRNSPSFCLMSGEDNPSYSIHIEDIFLRVCKVKINPAIIYGHAEALQKTNAKYPYTKTEIKMMSIPKGQISFTWDNIFQGNRPNKLIIGLVNANAVAGNYTLNPFNFKHYNLTRISVLCDGVPVGSGSINLNYNTQEGENVIPAYINLFQVCGQWQNNVGNYIDRDEMGLGYALYGFDLQPTFQQEEFLHLTKQGVVRLELQFGSVLPEAASIIVYSEKTGYFEIDQSRNIITEG